MEEGIPRTNNKLDAWHMAIQRMLGSPHQSILRFVTAIQKEQQKKLASGLMKFISGQEVQNLRKYMR